MLVDIEEKENFSYITSVYAERHTALGAAPTPHARDREW